MEAKSSAHALSGEVDVQERRLTKALAGLELADADPGRPAGRAGGESSPAFEDARWRPPGRGGGGDAAGGW